jgi:hypothetical protein
MRRVLPFEVTVAGPCGESWDAMSGSLRERFCPSCSRSVHDLAAMTPSQIDRLVAKSGGRLCGRITRRQDGSLVMLEPVPSRPRLATLTLSVVLGVAPAALAQSGSASPSPSFSLKGTVRDIQGAVIVGSKITLVRGDTLAADTATDTSGQFALMLPMGQYQLLVTAPGFSHFSAPVSASSEDSAVAEVTLKSATEVTVQVVSSPPTLDATTGGVLAISYGPWYKRLEFHLRHPILFLKHIF